MNGDPLLSFMCTGVKQAEAGTPSKARGPGTEALPHSEEQEAPSPGRARGLMMQHHVHSRWGTDRVMLTSPRLPALQRPVVQGEAAGSRAPQPPA